MSLPRKCRRYCAGFAAGWSPAAGFRYVGFHTGVRFVAGARFFEGESRAPRERRPQMIEDGLAAKAEGGRKSSPGHPQKDVNERPQVSRRPGTRAKLAALAQVWERKIQMEGKGAAGYGAPWGDYAAAGLRASAYRAVNCLVASRTSLKFSRNSPILKSTYSGVTPR